jgi:3-oxoacyl-[acyl-carrier-protein] synthase-1
MSAVREVFNGQIPPISSTKALTGHGLGAAEAQEAIYCLVMMSRVD